MVRVVGAGSGGFVLFICDLVTRRKLIEYFRQHFKFLCIAMAAKSKF